MANSFGQQFKIHTFGESHGAAVGVIIDGCPPGYSLDIKAIQHALNRRRPGQSSLTTPRAESDSIKCLSGLNPQGVTLGTPLCLLVMNEDFKAEDYKDIQQVYRPSHADFTYAIKYGISQPSGGGRASARETIGRVAAAAVAQQVLQHHLAKLQVCCYVEQVHAIRTSLPREQIYSHEEIDQSPIRCPEPAVAGKMQAFISQIKQQGDSVGGIIRCAVHHMPVGLGEPVFDKLEADLAKAMLSLPATKGFEVGEGFAAAQMLGSEHNDAFNAADSDKNNRSITTASNHSGGIQGGISNGATIFFRVAFKPVATINKQQVTVTSDGKATLFKPQSGRHDPCVLPRAVPMVEAMTWLVLIDHWLMQITRTQARGPHSDIK